MYVSRELEEASMAISYLLRSSILAVAALLLFSVNLAKGDIREYQFDVSRCPLFLLCFLYVRCMHDRENQLACMRGNSVMVR